MNKLSRWVFVRRHGVVLDALRRSTELLDGVGERGVSFGDHHAEEVDHIRKVNRRVLLSYDPDGKTDRKAR